MGSFRDTDGRTRTDNRILGLGLWGRLNLLCDFSAEDPQVQMVLVQLGYVPGMVRTLEHALNQEGFPNAL